MLSIFHFHSGVLSLIACLMLLGTMIEAWEEVNPFPLLTKDTDDNMLVKILKSFSILSNGKQILSTETTKNHITCLSGIRTISMLWIIYGHLYMGAEFLLFQNFVISKKEMEDVSLLIMFHFIIEALFLRLLMAKVLGHIKLY